MYVILGITCVNSLLFCKEYLACPWRNDTTCLWSVHVLYKTKWDCYSEGVEGVWKGTADFVFFGGVESLREKTKLEDLTR